MENVNVKSEDLNKLISDIAQIKKMLLEEKEGREMEEIELTDWANNELEEARRRKTKISHEEAKKILFGK